MYGNHESAAAPATAGGSSASGASRPDRHSDTPACSSMTGAAGGREVDRPRQPEVELAPAPPAVQVPGVPRDGELVHQHQGEEVAGEIGPRVAGDLTLPGDRPPDAERHGRLRHAPQQPQHDGGAVLQVDEPGVADQGRVATQPGGAAHASSSATPRANATRITSSIGGSSIDRSATGSWASSRALVAAASSRGTSSTALGNRNSFTSPNAASCSAVTPSASMSSIRLV